MNYVVTLSGVKPIPRYDGLSWTIARIEESATANGPWALIDTITLVPDVDPSRPAARDLTTELAQLAEAWYRVTFVDETGDIGPASDPVFSGAGAAYRPSISEIGDLMRSRTKDSNGDELGTFNQDTRPTDVAVEGVITLATGSLAGCVGDWLPEWLVPKARFVIAMCTALLIELAHWPEQINDDTSPYRAYRGMYENWKRELCREAEPYRPEDQTSYGDPLFYFGDGLNGLDKVEYDPVTQRYIFRGEGKIWTWNA